MIRVRHPLPEDMHPMSATDWIGRSEIAHDHLSHNLLKRIAATFGEAVPADGQAIPALWQWCFLWWFAGRWCGFCRRAMRFIG